ncbi:MAG: hypothetical protein ACREKR_06540 [Candidatus Methylomirabilales bacterium]
MTVQTDAARMAERIRALLPGVKRRTLRIWGDWFGRPFDNVHTIVGCAVERDRVTLLMDKGETLTIWNPGSFQIGGDVFIVGSAERVLWEWFPYGQDEDLRGRNHEDYVRGGDIVTVSHKRGFHTIRIDPAGTNPAVEIV